MNLAFYVRGFPPRVTGGTVEVAYHLVEEFLKDRRHRISLVIQTDASRDEIERSLGQPGGNLDLVRIPFNPSPADLWTFPEVARAFREADVIHFNEFPVRHLDHLLLAKLQGVPLVFSLHGLLSLEAPKWLAPTWPTSISVRNSEFRFRVPRWLVPLLARVYRWFAPHWTAVVAMTEALRRRAIEAEHFDPSRFVIIPNGVSLGEAPGSPPVPHDGPLRILFVGKLEELKGPDLLLAALEALGRDGRRVELSFVGFGSLESALRTAAERLPQHHVTFHGFIPRDQVHRFFAWSDVVVVPSRYDNFPVTLLEAMAAGRPIVATAVGGIPEIVRAPRNGILVEPTAESIADGIRTLLDHPEMRTAMARANLEDVRSYPWSAIAPRYLSLYHDIVTRSNPEAASREAAARNRPDGSMTGAREMGRV